MDFGMPFLLETPGIEDCCQLAQRLGLRFVEMNGSFPACQPDLLDRAALKAMMDAYHVYFTLHMDEAFNPFAPNQAIRRAWLDQLKYSLDLALDLGMPTVNMHMDPGVYITLPSGRVYLHARQAALYQGYVQELKTAAEAMLTGTATHLCIENTDGWQSHEVTAIDSLLASPVFGLTMDIGHMHCIDGLDEPVYQTHQDKLWHMHGHDARGKHPHLGLGDGDIDLHGRFQLANQCGARVVLETKTAAALQQSVDWLRREMPALMD